MGKGIPNTSASVALLGGSFHLVCRGGDAEEEVGREVPATHTSIHFSGGVRHGRWEWWLWWWF